MATGLPLIFETATDTYTSVRQIASGGSGVVYLAQDAVGGQYAVKVLDPSKATTDKRKRFFNELKFCSRFHHENIIQIRDHGLVHLREHKSPFYVMPFYKDTFRNVIGQVKDKNRLLRYFVQVLQGVNAAHKQNVVHRDLKPENVLFDSSTDRMLISDFGIAHFSEEDLLTAVETKADQRLANFIYAAPEQKARGQRTDGRTDIFALGLMLNEMFTGIVPHGTGYASIESVSDGHAFLDPLVERMTRNRPEDRPQTVEALLMEIEVREKEFASRQKIDSLKLIKIADDVPQDSLILDPIRLTGIDYSDGALHFKLSQSVNQLWVKLFKNIGAGLVGFLPENYSVQGDSASIRMDGRQPGFAQELTNYFKGYLGQTNQAYLLHVQMMSQRAAKEEQAKLAKKLIEEDHRLQILATIKI